MYCNGLNERPADLDSASKSAVVTPAIEVRFSRFGDSVQQDPVQRQEAQIVRSCMTLDDFLPGSWLPPVRWSDIDGRTIHWRAEHEKTVRAPHTDG